MIHMVKGWRSTAHQLCIKHRSEIRSERQKCYSCNQWTILSCVSARNTDKESFHLFFHPLQGFILFFFVSTSLCSKQIEKKNKKCYVSVLKIMICLEWNISKELLEVLQWVYIYKWRYIPEARYTECTFADGCGMKKASWKK